MKTSGTNTSATGHKGGLGDGLYDRAGARPDLDLDFARTKSLKDRVSKEDLITFTRGSGGTYVDESGLVKNARTNIHAHHAEVGPNHMRSGLVSLENPKGQITNVSFWTIAEKYSGLNGNTNNLRSGSQNGNDGSIITGSVYLRTNTGTVTVHLDCCDKNVQTVTVTDQWQRFSATTLGATGVNTSHRFFDMLIYNTAAGGATTLYGWGVQVETGGVATLPVIENTVAGGGAPRFTHDPETLESKGLLIEPQATNLLTRSEEFNYWVNSNTQLDLDTSHTNPDGTTGTYHANDYTGGHSEREVYSTFDASSASTDTVTFSLFCKKRPNSTFIHFQVFKQVSGTVSSLGVVCKFNPATGTFDTSGALLDNSLRTVSNRIAVQYPNDWYRIFFTVQIKSTAAGSNTFTSSGRFDIQNLHQNYLWGVQIEAGTVGTSYIPTSGSTVTRSPDLASIEGDNFGTYRKNLVPDSNPKTYNVYGTVQLTLDDYNALSPDGNYNASLVTEDATDNQHLIRWNPSPALADSTVYTVSCHFKEPPTNSRRYAALTMHGRAYMIFDLQTGTHVSTSGSGAVSNSESITDVGNGWYRCSGTYTTKTTGQGNAVYGLLHTGQTNGQQYQGDGQKGLYIWGYQCEEGNTLTPYIPSTDTYTNRQSNATFVDGNGIVRRSMCNQLLYSEGFDNSYWSKSQIGATANSGIAPDGTNTAFKLEATALSTGQHYIYKSLSIDGTISVYAKANGYNYFSIISQRAGSTQPTQAAGVSVNLTDGSIHDTKDGTAEVIDVGNGWYRIIFKRNPAGQVYTIFQPHDGNTTPDHNNNYRVTYSGGAGTGGVLLWGAMQTNDLTEAGDYYKTTGTISGPPRYSHDPETLTPTGLYLEPAATNYVTYSQPTSGSNWDTLGGNTTVTGSYAEAPDGTQTAVRVQMPDDNGTVFRTSVSVVSGTTYTFSVYLKSNHATLNTINVQVFNAGVTVDEAVTLTNEWVRYSRTFTATVTGNAEIGFDNGPIEVDFLFWGAQVEVGSIATSYIPTSGAEATRAADTFTSTATEVLDRANGTKPAFYTKNGLTAFVHGTNQPNPPTYAWRLFEFTGGVAAGNADFSATANTSGTRLGVFQHTDTSHAEPQGAGSAVTSPNTTLGLDNKIAIRYQTDNLKVNTNSVPSTLFTNIDARSSTRLCIGANGGTSGVGTSRLLNGTINRLTFWKTPFTDSKLDKLTTAIT